MAEENTNQNEGINSDEEKKLGDKLSSFGWSLFFIWIGLALLLNIKVAFTLFVVGIVTLGVQVARKYYKLKFEGFWVAVGLLFLVGGLWEILKIEMPLMPLLLIVVGAAILFALLKGKNLIKK